MQNLIKRELEYIDIKKKGRNMKFYNFPLLTK